MTFDILDGWWTDCGTFESLFRANKLVEEGMRRKAGKP
jgi:dTDP-glucose pyrophosphorylase